MLTVVGDLPLSPIIALPWSSRVSGQVATALSPRLAVLNLIQRKEQVSQKPLPKVRGVCFRGHQLSTLQVSWLPEPCGILKPPKVEGRTRHLPHDIEKTVP